MNSVANPGRELRREARLYGREARGEAHTAVRRGLSAANHILNKSTGESKVSIPPERHAHKNTEKMVI
jgi:hypothetical protein